MKREIDVGLSPFFFIYRVTFVAAMGGDEFDKETTPPY